MRNNVSLKSVIVGLSICAVGMYGATQSKNYSNQSTSVVYSSTDQGSNIVGKKHKGTVQMLPTYSDEESSKQNSSTYTSSQKANSVNEQVRKELQQYKQAQKQNETYIKQLEHTIDSLQSVCVKTKREASKLEAYAIEFHAMNKRYGNLPYKIEKDISTYLSKKK